MRLRAAPDNYDIGPIDVQLPRFVSPDLQRALLQPDETAHQVGHGPNLLAMGA
jgi:hypothetical protein